MHKTFGLRRWRQAVVRGMGACALVMGTVIAVSAAEVEAVRLAATGRKVEVRLDSAVPWRVYQIGERDVLVAFSHTTGTPEVVRSGGGKRFGAVDFSTRDGVGRLRIRTRLPVSSVRGVWHEGVNLLSIDLAFTPPEKKEKRPLRSGIKKPLPSHADGPAPDVVRTTPASERPVVASVALPVAESVPPRVRPEAGGTSSAPFFERVPLAPIRDGFDRMLELAADTGGPGGIHLRVAARQLRNGQFDEAGVTLGNGMMQVRDPGGRERLLAMKRTLEWRRLAGAEDPDRQVAFVRELERDLGVLDTGFARAWESALMAEALHRMANNPLAMGYTELVLNTPVPMPVQADAGYLAGEILLEKGDLDGAERMLRSVVRDHPDSRASLDARIDLGRLMFRKKRYFDALKLVNGVLRSEPERALENPDLLAIIGNSHFETGESREAVEALLQAVNCFPDMEGRDVLLTRVAESYARLEDRRRAQDLFRMVTDLYPGSDGYVRATLRLAEMEEDPTKAEAGFRTILDQYPDHDLARIARIRLAASRLRADDPEGCVTEIEPLFAQNPRGLRKDALGLMEKGLAAIFDRDLAKGRYAAVLERYDRYKRRIREMESPVLQARIGTAFLESRLWKPALYHLTLAERMGKGGKTLPVGFAYHKGVAAQENGDFKMAEAAFRNFLNRAEKNDEKRSFAWSRIARMREKTGDPDGAIAAFRKAADTSRRKQDKAILLRAAARISPKEKGRSHLLENAVRVAKTASEKEEASLQFDLFRDLGDAHVRQKAFGEAADAYEHAIRVGTRPEDVRAVRFALADAQVKSGRLDAARKTLEALVATDDPLWGSLARERLASLRVEGRLQRS